MSNNIEQYIDLMGKLVIDENKCIVLNDLKNFLSFDAKENILTPIKSIGIAKIIQCLKTLDNKQIEQVCEVLKVYFGRFDTCEILKIHTPHIMYLLRHDNESVRRLMINEISKTITSGMILPMPKYVDVYVAVSQMVCDGDVAIANKAVLITSNLPTEAYPRVLEEMKISLENNSSSKCNAYEVVINISSKSCELFDLCVNHGYIDFMINELYSEDILYQLNILEILTQLAITPHGLNYLVKQGTLKKISDLVLNLQKNPFGRLLTPGYIKFFGAIAHNYPKEIIQKHPFMIESLFDALNSDDITILPVALDTLGFIGTTIEGKMCLMALGSKYTQAVEKLGVIIKNSVTEIKVCALHCMAGLISINKDPNYKTELVDQRVTLMAREWFRGLSQQPASMEVVYNICKNPFDDIKLAGLTLLDAVCQHQWGKAMVAEVAGFIEYLLDRSVDYTKKCKEAKYVIIKQLALSTVFDENIISRLQKYVEEGPFYADLVTQVAMEGE